MQKGIKLNVFFLYMTELRGNTNERQPREKKLNQHYYRDNENCYREKCSKKM